MPDTVTSIGEAAFNGCNSITDITLPFVGESPSASYTEYGVLGYIFGYLVEYSDTIENMVLQYSKHSQGRDYYFYYHIPNTLRNVNITTQTAIPNYAFRNCSFIETITISSAVTIGYHAFRNCSNLKSIAIPESVTAILDNAFSGCNKLGGVYITDVEAWCNLSFSTEESNPLVYAKLLYLNDELLSNLIIPDGIASIKYYAFYNCTSIKNVYIPATVTSIGYKAFCGCTNIIRINSLADGELILPNGITKIYTQAFQGLEHITKVVVPDTVTSIGEAAFNGCNSITDITLPFVGESPSASYTEYGVFGYIFGYSVSNSADGEDGVVQYEISNWKGSTYYYYNIPKNMRNVIITSQTAIPNYAFRNCSFIETITVKSNTSFGIDALNNCNATIKYI